MNSFIVVFQRVIPLKFCEQVSCPFLNMGMAMRLCHSSGVFISFKILLNSCDSFLTSSGPPYFRTSLGI